eukprot:842887-Rhodomonas_salina.1
MTAAAQIRRPGEEDSGFRIRPAELELELELEGPPQSHRDASSSSSSCHRRSGCDGVQVAN